MNLNPNDRMIQHLLKVLDEGRAELFFPFQKDNLVYHLSGFLTALSYKGGLTDLEGEAEVSMRVRWFQAYNGENLRALEGEGRCGKIIGKKVSERFLDFG